MTSSYQALIGEEGEDAAGLACFITIIEMIYMAGVEVDGPFYQPHAENTCIKVDILLRIARESCNVVDAGDQLHDNIREMGILKI